MVRRADPGDLEPLAQLVAQFRDWMASRASEPTDEQIRATLQKLLADPNTEFLLALDHDSAPVAFCQLRYRLSVWTGVDDCWLEDLFVAERARRAGHGRALVEAAIDAARSRGCKRIELDVNEHNPEALALYLACGFEREPKPPGPTFFIGRKL